MEGLWNISPKWGLKFTGDGRRHEAIPSEPSNLLTTRVILLILTLKILKRQGATIIVRRIEISGLRRGRRQSFKGTRVRILHWSKPLEAIVYKSSCVHFVSLSYSSLRKRQLLPLLVVCKSKALQFWRTTEAREVKWVCIPEISFWMESDS